MGRVRRVDVGGRVYHGWNRANFCSRLFKTEVHYQDFPALVEESLNFVPMCILAYCLMPNHWHLRKSKNNSSAGGRWPRTCEEIPQRSKALRAEAQRRGERKENKAVVLSESLRLCVSASRREIVQFFHTFRAQGLRGVAEPPPSERGNSKYPACPEAKQAVWFGALGVEDGAQFGLENTIRNPWRPEKGTCVSP
jgi:hypothetical protein